jgi:hypothetical protein
MKQKYQHLQVSATFRGKSQSIQLSKLDSFSLILTFALGCCVRLLCALPKVNIASASSYLSTIQRVLKKRLQSEVVESRGVVIRQQ